MLTQLNASELAQMLRERKISVKEVVEAHYSRIDALDSCLGCFLTLNKEDALKQAEDIQKKIDQGEASILSGIPIVLKDNISTAGLRTTCGSRILENYIPPYDAYVVEKLKEAGMIVLGKSNLDEFAMGTSTENSAFHVTRNPWDFERVPGGSSGGSAAAVAGGLSPLSLGSDTGGSIRQPAALCGVVGFKPTYGRVSRSGLVAFGSSLDQIGPFGRSVEDAALCAEVISGHDPKDSTSIPMEPISTKNLKDGSLRDKKFALPKEMFEGGAEPGVVETVYRAVEELKAQGAEFSEVSIPSIKLGVTTYYIIAPAEASSNLARFDGVRYGPRLELSGHEEMVARTRGQLFGHEVKSRIMIGTYALSAGYYDAFYLRAQKVRGLMAQEFETVFKEFDGIVCPTSPVVAFKIGELVNDPLAMKLLDYCSIPANMGGFPAISLNCGLYKNLPVGLQLIGPIQSDEKVLQLSYCIEQSLPHAFAKPPLIEEALR